VPRKTVFGEFPRRENGLSRDKYPSFGARFGHGSVGGVNVDGEHAVWNSILLELALSASGGENLEDLVQKAAFSFLYKLDCVHVGIFQWDGDHLQVLYALPQTLCEESFFQILLAEIQHKLFIEEQEIAILRNEGYWYYGFHLHRFGVLLLGRGTPLEGVSLKELLPIVNILAQNCFLHLDAVARERAIQIELEQERHLLRAIIDAIPDLILYKDQWGKYRLANEAARKFFSLSLGEIQGKSDQDLRRFFKTPKREEIDHLVLETGRVWRYEEWLKTPAGETGPLETVSVPVYDGKGRSMGTVAVSRNIAERLEAEKKIRAEKKWLEILFTNSTDAIVLVNCEGVIEETNESFRRLFGYTCEEVRGRKLETLFQPTHDSPVGGEYTAKLLAGDTVTCEATHCTKEGVPVTVMVRGFPVVIEERILGAYILYTDITERKRYEEKLKYFGLHDSLTGLYNRRFLEGEMQRIDAIGLSPVSAIVGDVNGLKLVNDVFGHEMGDQLLKEAATIIRKSCRRGDLVARWGGDEFVVLLPHTDNVAVERICERIKERCEALEKGCIHVSIALGYATKMGAKESIWQVLKEAEDWMYRHKLLQTQSYRNAIISSLRATLLEKSMETEEHAERLKEMSLQIACKMGLSAKQMSELELLAVLHDIGKIGVRESILLKPGPLTDREWEEMKRHVEIGYRIAQRTPELASIAEYILFHHERFDGRGYPRGLQGDDIPLLSRILAVVDAFDAMVNDRVYRKAMGKEWAFAEIERNSGKQFDPQVVEVFLSLFEEKTN